MLLTLGAARTRSHSRSTPNDEDATIWHQGTEPADTTPADGATTPVKAVGLGGPLRIALLGYRSQPHAGGQGVYMRYPIKALVEAGASVDAQTDGKETPLDFAFA